jgi:hypothetical protein
MHKLIAAAALAATAASPLAAQAYKTWVPSKEITNVTMVRVMPGAFDQYMAGLKQTWLPACEEQKKMGTVIDCGIYASTTMNNRDFNVILTIVSPSAGATDPDQARDDKLTAALQARLSQEKRDGLVASYKELRSFFGEQDFRRITLK